MPEPYRAWSRAEDVKSEWNMIIQVNEGQRKELSICFISENEQEQRSLYALVKAMRKDPDLHLSSYVSTACHGEDGVDHVLLVADAKAAPKK